jgi:hypothetical protein
VGESQNPAQRQCGVEDEIRGPAVVGAFMVADSVVEAIPGRRGGDRAAL